MAQKMQSISGIIKKELIRAVIERAQAVDSSKINQDALAALKFDDVEEKLNIAYINREETPLAMDVFKPVREPGTELPVIVTIHGGGLAIGDRHISRPFGRFLAHKGYLVFSVEYRLAPRANSCQQLDDVCAGLNKVGEMLVDYDVDFDRLFLIAESAGAYLATYVTAMKGSKALQEAIGYEPSHMTFKAIGLVCGMFYTDRKDPCGLLLKDQIYGDLEMDENFMQYMNPENPEIINNLPPAYMVTSQGDFLNNYTLLMHEAMKKAGRICHLKYIANPSLGHAFTVTQTVEPATQTAIDDMLKWMEGQADIRRDHKKIEEETAQALEKMLERCQNGDITRQRVYKFIKECAGCDPQRIYKPALIDGTRTYSYGQLFEEWERYAKVFTGLGISTDNKSRAAICGSISAEPLFAFYGLNMTGITVSMFSYPDFLPGGKWKQMIMREKITDLIISDIMVSPQLWYEMEREKEKLGLKHIIFLHTKIGGPCCGPAELAFNEFNYHALKRISGTVFMEDLIPEYADQPIAYATDQGNQLALITHTSGTVKGTRKPLPYTDQAVIDVASRYISGKVGVAGVEKETVIRLALSFDLSSFLSMGSVNMNLSRGNVIILTFFGFLHPKFIRALEYYKANAVFTTGFMIDKWMERTDIDDVDLSCLEFFGTGGSYISTDKLAKYTEFMEKHGYHKEIQRAYGMSETGGAQLIMPPDCGEDIMGYPADNEDYYVLDEKDNCFYTAADGERTGILYVASDTKCQNTLDGEILFELTKIKDRNYVCTNDLVRVNEKGWFIYAGRADRYFANNEGVRFDAGIVETMLLADSNIEQCVVVPVLDKRIHDTVPVLYVIPDKEQGNAAEAVRRALKAVFINNERGKASPLPTQFLIVDEIPCNSNGKPDIYRITRERLNGTAYDIKEIVANSERVDIKVSRAYASSMFGGNLPEGMGKDSAYNIFEMLNAPAPSTHFWPRWPGLSGFLPGKKVPKAGLPFTVDELMNKMTQNSPQMMSSQNKMQGWMFGQVDIKEDFEE